MAALSRSSPILLLLPAHVPARIPGWSERSLLYVGLEVDGLQGLGEAAPLEGKLPASKEAVLALAREARAAARELLVAAGARSLAEFDAALERSAPSLSPPLRMAASGAFLTLLAARQECPVAALLGGNRSAQVPLAGFVRADPRAVRDLLSALERESARPPPQALKVKVGRAAQVQVSLAKQREALDFLARNLPPNVTLRPDANATLSAEEASSLFSGLPPERVDYLEEPLAERSALPAFALACGHRIALDESLPSAATSEGEALDVASVWVLKGQRLGGAGAILSFEARARARGKQVVVSSSYESSLGLALLAEVAAALPAHRGAAGLGTAPLLDERSVLEGYESLHDSLWRVGTRMPRPRGALLEKAERIPLGEAKRINERS